MLSVQPSIDAGLARIAPQFRALSMLVEAAPLVHPQVGEAALTRACAEVMAGGPVWAQAHLDAWSEVFKRFGAKPKRTPCSADALRKRVLRDGVMAAIDPVVDLYNAISLRYAIPVGGENLAAYAGAPRLVIAEGPSALT
jgi:DNA/RNA-binding domain of Phe-tRNA-synthetase-like protein